jgi:hypothetical protein
MAALHEQVGRLDVAVGKTGVPQAPDDRQALVDDGVVDLNLTDFLGAFEKLGDEQIFPFGSELDAAEGLWNRQAPVPQQPQRVVLVFDQPPDGVERLLVLEPAVQ